MLGSRTDLHIFDAGSVNGTRYCNEILLPYVRLFRGAMGLQFLFMNDNAPCHRTVAAEQLLESRRLAARTLPPVTIRELRLALQDEWAAMPQQLIDTLILSMGRRSFDQVSEFDRGRIVAYRDCGLSCREIGSRVGRNQTTVMRICDRWMQEFTTDQRGRSHPPQCIPSREDRQIVRLAVTDRSVTSRTVSQYIESVTHHSESACTIRRLFQQSGLSARRALLGLPLRQNHRRLRRQWCDERRM
ncbi:transposable element Tcb1 transposase [Trichonephila clavipes]|nr:transposable element Tcb1 transposase [Trichonephila clavipes]